MALLKFHKNFADPTVPIGASREAHELLDKKQTGTANMESNFADEESRLRALVEGSRGHMGDDLLLHIHWLVDFLLIVDEVDEAETLLLEGISLARGTSSPKSNYLSKFLADLAGIHQDKACHDDAVTLMREAVAAEKSHGRNNNFTLANRLIQFAHALEGVGHAEEAIGCYKEVLSLLPRVWGDSEESTKDLRFSLISAALDGLGEVDDAISFQESAVDIQRVMCAPIEEDSPFFMLVEGEGIDPILKQQLADSLSTLGRLYYSKNMLSKAKEVLQESLGVKQSLFPPDHSSIASTIEDIAMVENAFAREAPLA